MNLLNSLNLNKKAVIFKKEDLEDNEIIKFHENDFNKKKNLYDLLKYINNIDDYLLTLSKDKTVNNKIFLVYLESDDDDKSLLDIILKKILGKKTLFQYNI